LWDGFWRKDTKDAKTKDKGIYDLIKMTLIELIVYYYYYYYYYIYIYSNYTEGFDFKITILKFVIFHEIKF
jgi:hypothetical protein